jgi:hypothetical protein
LHALLCGCHKADIPIEPTETTNQEARVKPTRASEASLLATLAVDSGVGCELRARTLDVSVVSGVGGETADDGTSAALLVEEVVGVLGLDEGLRLAGQRVGSDEGSSEDGAAKVVVFALGPDGSVFRLGELLKTRIMHQFGYSILAECVHSRLSLGSHNHRVARSRKPSMQRGRHHRQWWW